MIVEFLYQPHPLYPPLLDEGEGGGISFEGAKPLFKLPWIRGRGQRG